MDKNQNKEYQRLGLRAVAEKGNPTLENRWDTHVYEEGLPSEKDRKSEVNSALAIQEEAERLISVAKEIGDFIPSTVWETFGDRSDIDSGESIVFMDEKHDRVVKFKDPFAYAAMKDENPYNALYEHHIHNYFFNDVPYRFLGVSQDPVSGRVRFAFEQPFIRSFEKPSKEEIDSWFKDRGFNLTADGFFYTDGYVSFTDVWGDNCFKDKEGNLRFIDPVVRFEKAPKKVVSHYLILSNIEKLEKEDKQNRIIIHAKQAILDRLNQPTIKGRLTDDQVSILKEYRDLFVGKVSDKDIFDNLTNGMKDDFKREMIGEASVDDLKDELKDLVSGQRRETVMGLKI